MSEVAKPESTPRGRNLMQVVDELFALREAAMDKEATYNIRFAAWLAIDDALDAYNALVKGEDE